MARVLLNTARLAWEILARFEYELGLGVKNEAILYSVLRTAVRIILSSSTA